jgi:hypothetical protein
MIGIILGTVHRTKFFGRRTHIPASNAAQSRQIIGNKFPRVGAAE